MAEVMQKLREVPAFLNEMLAEPFDALTFLPSAASVYQLGNFGTARKERR